MSEHQPDCNCWSCTALRSAAFRSHEDRWRSRSTWALVAVMLISSLGVSAFTWYVWPGWASVFERRCVCPEADR